MWRRAKSVWIGMSCRISCAGVILVLLFTFMFFRTTAMSFGAYDGSGAVYRQMTSELVPHSSPSHGCQEICLDPYTSSPDGTPCKCVIPIRVGLEFSVALYVLFPLVSELSNELASGIHLSQSQVRIVGADAIGENLDRTQVTANLMPLGESFDDAAGAVISQEFWTHRVPLNEVLFGKYSVLFVHYPGLPPSSPSQGSSEASSKGPNASHRVPGNQPSETEFENQNSQINGAIIAAISVSSSLAASIILLFIWFIIIKYYWKRPDQHKNFTSAFFPTKKLGTNFTFAETPPSTSTSYKLCAVLSSIKTFSLPDLKEATGSFASENIIGEGGFGRVYQGKLKDGTQIAAKVLLRSGKEGGHEFKAEVEMLAHIHHPNLVKLLGVSIENDTRCLVYELVQNRNLDWHIHGPNKASSPLKWRDRLKIALGAARALAYLHEELNPRVIHRDFKASNILLETDFTPRVSDFGLAKYASGEPGSHVSTRVMGTFGYVAPEYAMTGHLLVKSDVYSYGVVLLELLSGRRPIDMSKIPGHENLVTWTRHLSTAEEGLEILIDPSLRNSICMEDFATVTALALMCVQAEVSERPFMSEVVRLLEKVYYDTHYTNGGNLSGNETPGLRKEAESSDDEDPKFSNILDDISSPSIEYTNSRAEFLSSQRPLSASAVLSKSGRQMRDFSGPFPKLRVLSPLTGARSKPLWYRLRHPTRGTVSEQATPIYQDVSESSSHHSDGWR